MPGVLLWTSGNTRISVKRPAYLKFVRVTGAQAETGHPPGSAPTSPDSVNARIWAGANECERSQICECYVPGRGKDAFRPQREGVLGGQQEGVCITPSQSQ